ncbi:MAG: GDP-L-fucose synthase [Patescibacteria group bacterium]
MNLESKIFVAGHGGLVGSALVRTLEKRGYKNLILETRTGLDLLKQSAVETFFATEQPEYVFLAAAKVGGIMANSTYPVDFIYQNLMIQTNIIHHAYKSGVKKLLFLGSSCIYPRNSPQPIKEEYLMTGALEPTNRAYATAKITGIIMCQSYNQQYGTNFISLMPTNLYGPNDNFDPESSHVIPALIRKFHDAKINKQKEVTLWGTGSVRREFLHVDDLARAALFLMNKYDDLEIINVGIGKDITIKELANIIKKVVSYEGKIIWDTTKPDGMPRKLLDISKISVLGWQYEIKLEDGIKATYDWFKKKYE